MSDARAATAVVFNDTRGERHHGCARVMTAIEALLGGIGVRRIVGVASHHDWRTDGEVLGSLAAARLVVVNGEGTLHHDAPAAAPLLAVAGEAHRLGIPSALVNSVWQDNGPAAAAALREFTLVAARDRRSAAQMRAAGVDCRVVPDLSLWQPVAATAGTRRGVGFTDSVGRVQAGALVRARRRSGGAVVPIQRPEPGLVGAWRFLRGYLGRDDLRDPRAGASRSVDRWRQLASSSASVDQYLARLAGLELLVAGRFHACTLALAVGTPFVALPSNSHKIEALVEDAGLASWRVLVEPTAEAIAEARVAGWSAAERAALDAYLAQAHSGADELFRDIGKLL